MAAASTLTELPINLSAIVPRLAVGPGAPERTPSRKRKHAAGPAPAPAGTSDPDDYKLHLAGDSTILSAGFKDPCSYINVTSRLVPQPWRRLVTVTQSRSSREKCSLSQ